MASLWLQVGFLVWLANKIISSHLKYKRISPALANPPHKHILPLTQITSSTLNTQCTPTKPLLPPDQSWLNTNWTDPILYLGVPLGCNQLIN